MDYVEELRWRGMIHDMTPGTEERLKKEPVTAYAGFDPTAPSLQIGNLVPVMMLMHLQRAGHKPLALVGGATGMIGDPSGKSAERNLLSKEEIDYNIGKFKKQLEHFLDFDTVSNPAEIVNNYDWFKDINFLDFLRDAGKHLTVGYMLAKESVKQRMASGISFTEFSYQLLQGYDYYWLNKNKNCELQVGGSDQWGNITAGTELIRRKNGGDAYALTCPLITKADGAKFGKSAAGEKIWLDPDMTSPYKFYQFWLNCSDEDAVKFIKIFSMLSENEIAGIIQDHESAPHQRYLQKALAKDITTRVHSESSYKQAVEASSILFGKGTTDALINLDEKSFLDIFEGVPQSHISISDIENDINVISLLVEKSNMFSSKGEARRMISNGGVSINKTKVKSVDETKNTNDLLNGKYILLQSGKKNYKVLVVDR